MCILNFVVSPKFCAILMGVGRASVDPFPKAAAPSSGLDHLEGGAPHIERIKGLQRGLRVN
jgi:hypothetical protein